MRFPTRTPLVLAALLLAGCLDEKNDPASPDLRPEYAAAAGFGDVRDLYDTFDKPSFQPMDPLRAALFRENISGIYFGPPPDGGDPAAVESEFSSWFRALPQRLVAQANTDFELFEGLSYFWEWLVFAEAIYPDPQTTFAKELKAFDAILRQKLRRAVDGNLAVCASTGEIGALANVILWADEAADHGLNTPSLGLDRQTIRNRIAAECARVKVVGVDLPLILEVGKSYILGATFVLEIGQPFAPKQYPFDVTIASSELNVQHPFGRSNAAGLYETVVVPTAAGQVHVNADGCLILPNRPSSTQDVCNDTTFTRLANDPPDEPPPATLVNATVGLTEIFDPSIPFGITCPLGATLHGTMTGFASADSAVLSGTVAGSLVCGQNISTASGSVSVRVVRDALGEWTARFATFTVTTSSNPQYSMLGCTYQGDVPVFLFLQQSAGAIAIIAYPLPGCGSPAPIRVQVNWQVP